MRTTVIIVMGVSGAGKTTVGQSLADRLGWAFFDADDFHPPANIEKMSRGQPLDDDDRGPWLESLASLIDGRLRSNDPAVMACSALKQAYRRRLRADDSRVQVVFLNADPEVIAGRLGKRDGHFMPPKLLRSQFDTLELPRNALTVDASGAVSDIVSSILETLD